MPFVIVIFIVFTRDLRSSSPMLMLKSILQTAAMPKGTAQTIASSELDAENEEMPMLPTYFSTRKFTIRQRSISPKREIAPG